MKKILTFLVVLGSLGYYTALPFFVAQAGGVPTSSTASTVSTALAASATSTAPVVSSTIYLRVTAYTSLPDETDNTPFITANGTYVHDGVAASNLLPFGTKIEIPALFGNKVFTIEDRTSPRFRGTVDLWMPSYKQAIDFGANYATIVVLGNQTSTPSLALK